MTGVSEDVWIEVIQKMDKVYNDLLQYEVALEEKNAELEESQNFIMSVIGSMSDILIVCDRNGRIEVVNQALVNFTGKEQSGLIGKPFNELFADPADRAAAEELFVYADVSGTRDCERLLRDVHGNAVPVSFNCTPRINVHGVQAGMVFTGRPIGELRRAYQALHDAHENLKRTQQQLLHAEKMASLGRLVAGVAHELNNPISFVLGNVHALHRYAERLEQYLAAIHTNAPKAKREAMREDLRIDRLLEDIPSLIEGTIEGAERTRDIVDSLKRYSAIDRNEFKVFNLAEVIERAIYWVTKAVSDRFKVTSDLPERIEVLGSSGLLQQVVMNLVQNAIDATAEIPDPALKISARTVGQQIEIYFADNGPGIPVENLAHLFEPFFTTKEVGKGTGLGLAISYGIVVERHGGMLSARNLDRGGAMFVLSMPLAPSDVDNGLADVTL
jgi:two-component system sensor histidine kinase HupT/HoxJ